MLLTFLYWLLYRPWNRFHEERKVKAVPSVIAIHRRAEAAAAVAAAEAAEAEEVP